MKLFFSLLVGIPVLTFLICLVIQYYVLFNNVMIPLLVIGTTFFLSMCQLVVENTIEKKRSKF